MIWRSTQPPNEFAADTKNAFQRVATFGTRFNGFLYGRRRFQPMPGSDASVPLSKPIGRRWFVAGRFSPRRSPIHLEVAP